MTASTMEREASAGRVSGSSSKGGRRPSVVSLAIREHAGLQNAYMRFVQGGGLFVPTARQARLGDELYLILSLLNDPTRHAVSGTVVWVTPAGSTGRSQGLGIQFARNEVGEHLRQRIENLIGVEGGAVVASHTM